MSNYLTGLAQLNPQVKRHDGNTTTLTLDENGTTNATMLFVNGVAQTPGIDFNVSGATLTTTSTLPAGTNIATTIQYFNTGVVNTVADDAIGLGQMASGTDGNLITYDASGNPAHVATGSDGQVLTSAGAGAAPAFEALPSGGGWEFVSLVTASSSATVTFTGIATGYDYMVTYHNVAPATNLVYLTARFGVAGPTYRDSNYFNSVQSLTTTTNGSIDDTALVRFSANVFGNVANETGRGQWIIFDPAGSNDTEWIFNGGHRGQVPTNHNGIMFGHYTTAESHVAIEFKMNSGNIATGFFKLYRRANA